MTCCHKSDLVLVAHSPLVKISQLYQTAVLGAFTLRGPPSHVPASRSQETDGFEPDRTAKVSRARSNREGFSSDPGGAAQESLGRGDGTNGGPATEGKTPLGGRRGPSIHTFSLAIAGIQ